MDNRLRLPGDKVDFNQVGTTGQAHDSFPAPGQARYDHMRMYLIALLANQSSTTPPTEKRDGTLWFDLTTVTMKVYKDGAWVPFIEAIAYAEGVDQQSTVTLAQWIDSAQSLLDSLAPDLTFSGTAVGDASLLPIPQPLQSGVKSFSRPLVWVNGLLVDPRNCTMQGTTSVQLSTSLRAGDSFTVLIRGFPNQNFHLPSVRVPT